MRMLKIYLAGAMGKCKTLSEMNGWREKVKTELENSAELTNCIVNVINPVDYYNYFNNRHQTEEEVEEFDLNHVISSNIIVVNLEGLSSSDGTKIELHDANYHNRIPVIAFGDRELYENLHPWVKRNITRVEENIEKLVCYITDFYMR